MLFFSYVNLFPSPARKVQLCPHVLTDDPKHRGKERGAFSEERDVPITLDTNSFLLSSIGKESKREREAGKDT